MFCCFAPLTTLPLFFQLKPDPESGDGSYQGSMKKIAQVVFSKHGVMWTQQCLRAKQELSLRSRDHATRRSAELQSECQSLTEQLDMLEQQVHDASLRSLPIKMSASALNERDLELFHRLINDGSFTAKSRIAMVRENIARTPFPQPVVGSHIKVWGGHEQQQPDWSRQLASHRELFESCALVLPSVDDTEEQVWKVIYAVQTPHPYVAVARLTPLELFQLQPPPHASLHEIQVAHQTHLFKCNYGIMQSAADMPRRSLESMLLLRGLQHMGGPEIASNWGQPCHIQSMLRGAKPLPVPKASKVEKAEHHDKQYEQLLKSLPWLTFLDESAGLISETHKIVAASSASSAHHDPAPLLEMTDDDMFAALARMDRSRSAEAAAALERGTR